MATPNAPKVISMALATAVVCVSLQAHATAIQTSLTFTDPGESIWGPGTNSSAIHYSDSAGFALPFDLGSESFGYSVDVGAGSVNGNIKGSVTTSYAPTLSAPGVTNIGMQFAGDPNGGNVTTVLGASASLTAFNQTFGPSFGMMVNSAFTPSLNSNGAPPGVGVYDIADPTLDLLAASADLDFGIIQNNYFTSSGIAGTLYYQLQGSNLVQSQSFNLADGISSLPVNLSRAGTYDFWFGHDWDLANQFKWSAVLGLNANASTAVGCGSDLLESCNWSTTLANPTIYDGDPFALNFQGFAPPTSFQITVRNVPLPHGLGLATLGGGLLLLGALDGWRRRRG